MHPAHRAHRAPKSSSAYIYAVIALTICLLLATVYWKREVNLLTVQNQKAIKEMRRNNEVIKEQKELIQQMEEKVHVLESDFANCKQSEAKTKTEYERVVKKETELRDETENQAHLLAMLEQSKAEVDAKLQKCEDRVSSIDELETENSDLESRLQQCESKNLDQSVKSKERIEELTEKLQFAQTGQKVPSSGKQKPAEDVPISEGSIPSNDKISKGKASIIEANRKTAEKAFSKLDMSGDEPVSLESGAIVDISGNTGHPEILRLHEPGPVVGGQSETHSAATKSDWPSNSNPRTGTPYVKQAESLAESLRDNEEIDATEDTEVTDRDEMDDTDDSEDYVPA